MTLDTGRSTPSAKLTDFGIGQVVSHEYLAGVTATGFSGTIFASGSSSRTGTQAYLAPEVVAGKAATAQSIVGELKVRIAVDQPRILIRTYGGDIAAA